MNTPDAAFHALPALLLEARDILHQWRRGVLFLHARPEHLDALQRVIDAQDVTIAEYQRIVATGQQGAA